MLPISERREKRTNEWIIQLRHSTLIYIVKSETDFARDHRGDLRKPTKRKATIWNRRKEKYVGYLRPFCSSSIGDLKFILFCLLLLSILKTTLKWATITIHFCASTCTTEGLSTKNERGRKERRKHGTRCHYFTLSIIDWLAMNV